jgi:hypothetical protein
MQRYSIVLHYRSLPLANRQLRNGSEIEQVQLQDLKTSTVETEKTQEYCTVKSFNSQFRPLRCSSDHSIDFRCLRFHKLALVESHVTVLRTSAQRNVPGFTDMTGALTISGALRHQLAVVWLPQHVVVNGARARAHAVGTSAKPRKKCICVY